MSLTVNNEINRGDCVEMNTGDQKLKTGDQRGGAPLHVRNPLWLAPLAGVTLPPVRRFFSRLGAGLTHTEMISCMGITHGNRKTAGMLRILEGEGPVVLQLFAPDVSSLVGGAGTALRISSEINAVQFAALGINMACPMPKVTKRGAGAALMNAPDTAFEMTRGLKKLGLPVWIKTRRGEGERPESLSRTLRFVEGLVNAGADNVCVHGRTPAQRYEGRADKEIVGEAAAKFPGKISASGDVYAPEDVLDYIGMGCVGVMLARGAVANPFLFRKSLLALGFPVSRECDDTFNERIGILLKLSEELKAECGDRLAVVLLKRFLGGVLRGFPMSAEARRAVGVVTDFYEMTRVLRSFAG
ncbi:tRNA-dihydrouridine synthase [Synergistales bacterium]|nr:tRNA-dihydrouridine synthase [Synergistales bacterium]